MASWCLSIDNVKLLKVHIFGAGATEMVQPGRP